MCANAKKRQKQAQNEDFARAMMKKIIWIFCIF
jgi:hypothetical protein